jgi:drug/metabolite transporter (DMT)-like permease
MNPLLYVSLIAMVPREYNTQGALASPWPGIGLFLIGAVCLAMFLVLISRPNRRPQRFFSPNFALAIAPILCSTASLVLDLFRILEVSGRVEMGDALLEHRIGYALRPLYAAVIASALALLILFRVTLTTRNDRNV